jgi:hypothetical protein
MSVVDQVTGSIYSLDGSNNLSNRTFGYFASDGNATELHDEYSVDSIPIVKIVDFNGNSTVRPESHLDELDPLAPENYNSIIYKSTPGQTYATKNPPEGGHF